MKNTEKQLSSLSIMNGDIHTTDLTEPCLRKVLLRHQEKSEPVAPTALFRGLLAGKALEKLHFSGDVEECDYEVIWPELVAELASEGREPSESVITNRESIIGQVDTVVQTYKSRLMPLFDKCDVIGTELPCRLKIGEINFASHVDLLVRDTDDVFGYGRGRILCIDWKFREEVPTRAYLSRNLQFAMYWLAILEGSVMTFPAFDQWEELNENAQMLWCHLPYLAPFKRKTTCKDADGNPVTYFKGDDRPINNILRDVNFKTECIDSIKRDMTERVEVMRAGYFPKSPEPVRCTTCDVREFCNRGDTPELLENQDAKSA